MVDIVLRTTKGGPLTYLEVDGNFTNLKTAVEAIQSGGTAVQIKTDDNNILTYNDAKLYVSGDVAAEYAGVVNFNTIIQPESFVTPVYDYGDSIRVGNSVFKKIYRADDMSKFAYLLDRRVKLKATSVNLSNVNNGTTTEKTIGTIKIPGDSLRLSKRAKVSVTITSADYLSNFEFSVGMHPYIRPYRKVKKTISSVSATSKTLTMEFYVNVTHAGAVEFSDDGSATAPSSYPSTANKIFYVNTLANVELTIYAKWNASVTIPNNNIQALDAYVELVPIDKFQNHAGVTYREASDQPYPSDDIINKPLTDKIAVKYPVSVYNYNTTGNSTSGTINAQGVAGSDLITLYSVTGIKVGMYGAITTHTPTFNGDPTPSAPIDSVKTINYLGQGNRVIEVLPLTNQVRMKFPVKTSFAQRGRETSGLIYGMSFYEDTITLNARFLQADVGTRKGYITNLTMAGSDTKAVAYPDKIGIFRISQDDPIRLWKSSNVVAYNPWLFAVPSSQVINFGESIVAQWYMKTPAGLTDAAAASNYDRNSIILTEDGRYSIESINTRVGNDNVITTSRSLVTDLNGYSYYDILGNDDAKENGASFGTRCDGAGLLRGIIRNSDMATVPVTANIETETEAQIDANIELASNAIKHAIPMVMAGAQMKGYQYSAAQTPESAATYKSFKSQHDSDLPIIAAGGTGYALGDALEIVGGTFVQPMVVTVTSVDSGGAVNGIFVSNTGQYEVAPTGVSALATTNISNPSATGCIINCINGGTSITSDSTAFPNMSQRNVRTYPAICVDNGWNARYNGTVPVGAWFTVAPNKTVAEIKADWKQRRISNPTDFGSSYEFLAIYMAAKKYGAFVCDIAGQTHIIMVGESLIPSIQWGKATGNNNGDHRNCNTLKFGLFYIHNITRDKVIGGTPFSDPVNELYSLNG